MTNIPSEKSPYQGLLQLLLCFQQFSTFSKSLSSIFQSAQNPISPPKDSLSGKKHIYHPRPISAHPRQSIEIEALPFPLEIEAPIERREIFRRNPPRDIDKTQIEEDKGNVPPMAQEIEDAGEGRFIAVNSNPKMDSTAMKSLEKQAVYQQNFASNPFSTENRSEPVFTRPHIETILFNRLRERIFALQPLISAHRPKFESEDLNFQRFLGAQRPLESETASSGSIREASRSASAIQPEPSKPEKTDLALHSIVPKPSQGDSSPFQAVFPVPFFASYQSSQSSFAPKRRKRKLFLHEQQPDRDDEFDHSEDPSDLD